MATAQMNFRIDAGLKAAGNLALGENGLTPSQVVRDLWRFLANNRHAPAAIGGLVGFLRGESKRLPDEAGSREAQGAAPDADDVFDEGPRIIQGFYDEMGVDPKEIAPVTFEELKLQAFAEKFPELGGVL